MARDQARLLGGQQKELLKASAEAGPRQSAPGASDTKASARPSRRFTVLLLSAAPG